MNYVLLIFLLSLLGAESTEDCCAKDLDTGLCYGMACDQECCNCLQGSCLDDVSQLKCDWIE